MTVRTYLPATLDDLRDLVAEGRLAEPPDGVVPETEDEEAEYAALMEAADTSATMRPGGRRVVIVAEVESPGRAVLLHDVVAVHCDTSDRARDADPDEDLAWFATQEIPDLI